MSPQHYSRAPLDLDPVTFHLMAQALHHLAVLLHHLLMLLLPFLLHFAALFPHGSSLRTHLTLGFSLRFLGLPLCFADRTLDLRALALDLFASRALGLLDLGAHSLEG